MSEKLIDLLTNLQPGESLKIRRGRGIAAFSINYKRKVLGDVLSLTSYVDLRITEEALCSKIDDLRNKLSPQG